jgi:hypothetical protein
MLTEGRWRALRKAFPQIQTGEADVTAGRWSDVVGNRESFAYEIGRAVAVEPPRTIPPGIIVLNQHIMGMIVQLVRFTE